MKSCDQLVLSSHVASELHSNSDVKQIINSSTLILMCEVHTAWSRGYHLYHKTPGNCQQSDMITAIGFYDMRWSWEIMKHIIFVRTVS